MPLALILVTVLCHDYERESSSDMLRGNSHDIVFSVLSLCSTIQVLHLNHGQRSQWAEE